MADLHPQLVVQDLVLVSDETGRVLLDRVSATVSPNERVGLIGASGAGKTLLARSLIGLLPPGVIARSGQIGHTSNGASDCPRHDGRQLASMVPQNPANALPPSATALRLVSDVASWTTGAGNEGNGNDASRLLGSVGLGAEMHGKRPHQLSGGMAMRVAIGAALATNPWFLVLDEPSSGLDPVTRKHLAELLLTISRDRETSLVIATHDLWMVDRLCDRILVIENGHIVAQGSPNVLSQTDPDSYVGKLFKPLRIGPEARSAQPLKKSEQKPALEVDGVTVDYVIATPRRKSVRALTDASLKVPRGGSTGIIGRSGAGKSTLAMASAGLLVPARGTIRVLGHRLVTESLTLRRENHCVRMVFQNPFATINPRRTIGAWLFSVLHHAARTAHNPDAPAISVAQSLAVVGLPDSAQYAKPAQLSGGECQRAVIAACIASQAEILILDEPVSMLDPIAREGIITLLCDLRRDRQWTYLVMSHDLPTICRLCESIVVLEDGRIVEAGALEEVMISPRHDVTKEFLFAHAARLDNQGHDAEFSGGLAKSVD